MAIPNRPVVTEERVIPGYEPTAELFREHLTRYTFASQLCRGLRVVDVGCGVGYGADLLRRVGADQVIGIDLSPDAVSYASSTYGSTSTHFVVADAARLPITDNFADLVVSFETIEHVADPVRVTSEIGRVLSKPGLAIISTPNGAIRPTNNPFHKHEFERDELERILRTVFPYVDVWLQDVVGVNRVVRASGEQLPMTSSPVFAYDLTLPPPMPSFCVGICSFQPIVRSITPVLVRTVKYTGGNLQQHSENLSRELGNLTAHVANLENAVYHLNRAKAELEKQRVYLENAIRVHQQHSSEVEARYQVDVEELRRQSTLLQNENSNLVQHVANLSDALSHVERWNADLLADRHQLLDAIATLRGTAAPSDRQGASGADTR
jgi:SAM-dependent methyltransferase